VLGWRLRSLSTDVANVLVEVDGVFDGVSARQSVEVVRVIDVLMWLRLGWQARRRARRTPLKKQVEVVTRTALFQRRVVGVPVTAT